MSRPLRIVAALAVLSIVFAAGSWVGWKSACRVRQSSGPATRQPLRYVCPMHPQYHSDTAGDCPSCGMKLEPVFAEGASDGPPAPVGASRMVKLDGSRQQLLGVRIGAAETAPGAEALRTVGRVAPDETRTFRLIAAVDGWIEDAGNASTGSIVTRNERLGTYRSPEFLSVQQAYLYALSSLQRFQKGNETPQQMAVAQRSIETAADSLRNFGMSQLQLDSLNKSLAVDEKIWIVSPAPGFVLLRNISPGQRFEKGSEFFRVADLSRIWILADIFEHQADFVKPGTLVPVTLPQRGRQFAARVSQVQPIFDESSRTLKVRLELDNPGFALKPGMFVDVEFPVTLPAAVTVPSEAVVDSGLRRTVFVDRGNGYFEPRRVETGWRMGDRVQIVSGLSAGERIVVSGTFLLDSESRMRSAAAGVITPETDVVCGMDVDHGKATAAGLTATHKGATYYFCSEQCRKDFEKEPGKYAR